MSSFRLPGSAHFAKVVVGWNPSVSGFFLDGYGKDAHGGVSVSFSSSSIQDVDKLDELLLRISPELELPFVLHLYLVCEQAGDALELARLEPLVAQYREE